MTMIEVGSRKQPAQEPQGRQRFEYDPDAQQSKTPFQAGFLLSALILYYKSMSDAWSELTAPKNPKTADEPTPEFQQISLAMADSQPLQVVPEEEQALQVGGKTVVPFKSLRSNSYLVDETPWITDINIPIAMGVEFSGLIGRSTISQGIAVGFSVLPSNDNRSSPGSGGGGGGLGGGTGDSGGDPDTDSDGDSDGDGDGNQDPVRNRAPVVNRFVELNDQLVNLAVVISLTDLLRGVVDPDGDPLSIQNARVSSGHLQLVNGGYRFVSEQPGLIKITYTVTDGKGGFVDQYALVEVLERGPNNAGDDILIGTPQEDFLDGGDGNDSIEGLASDDLILGGNGNDLISGGDGDDIVYGGDGDDIIRGGDGDDIIFGGAGNDILRGDRGSDSIFGGLGNDIIWGDIDGWRDIYDGGEGQDTLNFSSATTSLSFNLSTGEVTSGDETDFFAGMETFVGGNANDTFVANIVTPSNTDSSPPAQVALDGGAGNDTANYDAAQQSITVDMQAGTVTGAEVGTHNISNIETVKTGSGNDVFIAAVTAAVESSDTPDTDEYPSEGDAHDDHSQDDQSPDDHDHQSESEDSSNHDSGHESSLDSVASTALDNVFDGGEGSDTLSYASAGQDLVFDLNAGTVTGVEVGTDHVSNFETYIAGNGSDTFFASVDSISAPSQSSTAFEYTDADGNTIVGDIGTAEYEEGYTETGTMASVAVPVVDSFDAGAGTDTLSYESATQSITINMAEGTASGAEIGTDSFSNFEAILTGAGDDLFVASVDPEEASVKQSFDGGEGVDAISYATATESVIVDLNEGTVTGVEIGTDHVENIESFITGSGDDVFVAALDRSDDSGHNSSDSSDHIEVGEDDEAYSDGVDDVAEVEDLGGDDVLEAEDESEAEYLSTASVSDSDSAAAEQYFDGGSGVDTLSYAAATQSIVVDLEDGTATGSEIGRDHFENIESFVTGSGDDTIVAEVETEEETDASETEYVQSFDGGGGRDTLSYTSATEAIIVNVAVGSATGAEIGTDVFEDIETFVTGSGNDEFVAATDDEVATEEDSEESAVVQSFDGGAGEDTLNYSTADLSITVDANAGVATGSNIGVDTFTNIENIVTGSGNDVVIANTSCDNSGNSNSGNNAAQEDDRVVVRIDSRSGGFNFYDGGEGTDTLSYNKAREDLTINVVTGQVTGEEVGTDTFRNFEMFVGGAGNDTFIVGSGSVTLEGRGGEDTFIFTGSETGSGATSDHHIRNFTVGDIVRLSHYDIFEDAADELEDAFEDVYGESFDADDLADSDVPIRIRFDMEDNHIRNTYVEADLDNDTTFEVSIQLDGFHDLIIVTNNPTGA